MSNSENIFFINMEKNIGKRYVIHDIVKKLNGTIWKGVDKSTYSREGILLKSVCQQDKTRAAKEAKLNLLHHFIKTSTSQYLILFEDDIILHKNFYEYFDKLLTFANTTKFKLIYMGVSCNVPNSDNSCAFSINPMPIVDYRFSGAYGVIIHKSIMQSIISRSNDPFLFNKPFDIYSLGHTQICYPSECFICSPQLVTPDITISDIRDPRSQNDFWKCCHINKSDYIFNSSIPMYILADTNLQKIEQFISILPIFIPYIKPIFVSTCNNELSIEKYKNIYDIVYVDNFSNETIKNNINDTHYVLTNIYINWTNNIENIFSDKENIHYIVDICPICKNNNLDIGNIDPQILNGLSIVCGNSPITIKYNKKLFYVDKCKSFGETMHYIT